MATGFNRVTLIGRLTKDVQLRQTGSGISTTTFTVAVDKRYKQEGSQDGADYINCVAWRQAADFLGKYAHKGDQVFVDGRIQTRSYEKDGQRVYVTEVVADDVKLLGGRRDSQNTSAPAPAPAASAPVTEGIDEGDYEMNITDEDLPF